MLRCNHSFIHSLQGNFSEEPVLLQLVTQMVEWPAYYPPPDLLSGNASAQPDACNGYHQGHGQWHAQYAYGTGHEVSGSYAPESGSAPWMQTEQTQQPKYQVNALGAPNGCQVHRPIGFMGCMHRI